MFPIHSRVRVHTAAGPTHGTVLDVLDDAIEGDHVHRVMPDDERFEVMLLLGGSLESVEGVPFMVEIA